MNKQIFKLDKKKRGVFGNTRFTEKLARYAFDKVYSEDNFKKLHKIVDFLISSGSDALISILKQPNIPSKTVMPKNTPLLFSLKADDLTLFKKIISVYQSKDLLEGTYRKNNVAHLALALGADEYLEVIYQRAKELNLVGEVFYAENHNGLQPVVIIEKSVFNS